MSQAAQSFSPSEILQAGQRAEADGRADLSTQFYQHLATYYPDAPETAVATQRLRKLGTQGGGARAAPLSHALGERSQPLPQPPPANLHPFPATAALEPPPSHPAATAGHYPPLRTQLPARPPQSSSAGPDLPPRARGHLVGRVLAMLLLVVALLQVLAGIALLAVAVGMGGRLPIPLPVPAIALAPGLIGGGLVLALLAELCRAAFRAANATVDMANVQRALHEDGDEG